MNELSYLKDWVNAQALAERTVQQFWLFFQEYQQKHGEALKHRYGDFDERLLIIQVDRVALEIEDWSQVQHYAISVTIPVFYRKISYKKKGVTIPFKDGKEHKVELGYYILYFTQDGETATEKFELN